MDKKIELEKIIEIYKDLNYIHLEDMPKIPLYMDQLTSFMDNQLENQRRYPEDKILTKTMINNYSKNKILPPSDNKKYNRQHIILLIFIYYLKGFLSISDIKKLLSPLSKESPDFSVEDLYMKIVNAIKVFTPSFYEDILSKKEVAMEVFSKMEDSEDKKQLEEFALIALLSFDIHLKKKLIEDLLDKRETNE